MATVRAVPIPYPTPQAAHDAAQIGDTIVIAPGSHPGVRLTKAVHIVGDTMDPCARGVVLGVFPGGSYSSISLAIPSTNWGTLSTVLIEAVTPDWNGTNFAVEAAHDATKTVLVNRCNLTTATGADRLVDGNSADLGMRLLQCTRTVSGRVQQLSAPSRIEHFGCQLLTAPVNEGWALFVDDSVRTPTTGYGCAYGEMLRAQFMGEPLRLWGQIVLPTGEDRSAARVRIYRSVNGQPERVPWVEVTPNPVTGGWDVPYLPTSYTYWVQRIMPTGYAHRIDGPYQPIVA